LRDVVSRDVVSRDHRGDEWTSGVDGV